MYIDINGKLHRQPKFTISAYNSSIYYGFGVYEVFLVKNSQVPFYEEHINRLKSSLSFFNLKLPEEFFVTLKERIKILIHKNRTELGKLRLSFSVEELSPFDFSGKGFTTILSIQKIVTEPKPIRLTVSSYKRALQTTYPSGIKFLFNPISLLSAREAKERGFDEAVLLAGKDIVCEGSFCNLFWLDELGLKTPSTACGLLEGVTRSKILEAASLLNMEIKQGEYTSMELFTCNQMFISSSTRGLLRVSCLDDKEFQLGVSDEITMLQLKYEELQESSLKYW
jgi:branched-chain amino acid aminotransferase